MITRPTAAPAAAPSPTRNAASASPAEAICFSMVSRVSGNGSARYASTSLAVFSTVRKNTWG